MRKIFSKKHLLIIVSLFIVALGISILFPMFFRADDALNLYWTAHHHINDLFNVETSSNWGMYRPLLSLLFIIEYKLFGLIPFGYQLIITFIFFLDFYLLFYLVKTYFNRNSGIIALLAYGIFFYKHFQMAFWFSDIVFILHMMLTLLSIIFYLKSKKNNFYIIASIVFAFMGALTKEPSILIVASFVFGDLLISVPPRNYIKKGWVILPYIAIGLWLMLISPVMETRFKQSSEAVDLLSNLDYRYRYYFGVLLSGTRKIIPLLISALFALSLRKSSMVKLLVVLVAIPCYFNPYYYILFLFVALGLFAFQNKKLLPFLFWTLATSLTLPFWGFITTSYLFEFSFGFSVFIGFVFNEYVVEKYFSPFYLKKKLAVFSLLALALLCLPMGGKIVSNQIKALRFVVESRKNLEKGLSFIEKNRHKINYVVVPNQEDLFTYEEKAQKAIKSNIQKAKAQKVMSWREVDAYLSLLELENLQTLSYSKFIQNATNDDHTVLLLQNDSDISFAEEKGLIKDKMFSYSHFGTNNIIICSIKKNL
jgi:hypothetical protein